MEFSKQSDVRQFAQTNFIFVKQEFEDENDFTIGNNAVSMNTSDCEPGVMEFTEEKPVVPEIVENDRTVVVKQENTEDLSSVRRQDFVFVTCAADATAANETAPEKQNVNKNTKVQNSSAQQREIIKEQCPYCSKKVQQLSKHTTRCELKFIYMCPFCPLVLTRQFNITRHILQKHSCEVQSRNVDEIYQEIVAGRRELNVANIQEKRKLMIELMNANNIALMKAQTKAPVAVADHQEPSQSPVMIDDQDSSQEQFIIPDPIETHQKSTSAVTAELHTSSAPSAVVRQRNFDVSTAVKSNVPFVVVHEKIDIPSAVNVQDQSVVTQKTNAKKPAKNYVSCNECTYKTYNKVLMEKHIRCHADKSNVRQHKCNKCEKIFQSQEHLKVHEASCNVRRYYYCPFCPKSLVLKNMLKHVSSQHSKDIENKDADEIEHLIEAKTEAVESFVLNKQATGNAKCTPNKITKREYMFCNHCSYKTTNRAFLVTHIKRKHSAESQLKFQRVTFPKCKKVVRDIDSEAHSDSCGTKYNYTCLFCPTVYSRLDNVKRHVLRQHSSDLSNKTISEITREVSSKRTKVKDRDIDPQKIDASTLEYILGYCVKCKSLKTSLSKAKSRTKNCQDCGTRIIYLCSKCKEMRTFEVNKLIRHWEQCNKYYEISQFILDKLVLYSCSDCGFTSTHKHRFNTHIVRTQHKVADATNIEAAKNKEAQYLEMYDEAKFAVRPCVIDFPTMTRRYCPKCDKVITEDMQKHKHLTNCRCQVCGTRFLPQCVKCNSNSKSYEAVRYHLNTKCFPGDYRCTKCSQSTTSWQLMQKHYIIHHTNLRESFLCEFCSFATKHRTNFRIHMTKMHPDKATEVVPSDYKLKEQDRTIDYACDNCSFTSKHKYCLKVHLQNFHQSKKHKCKICKFRTKYEANLKRHYFIRHKNYY